MTQQSILQKKTCHHHEARRVLVLGVLSFTAMTTGFAQPQTISAIRAVMNAQEAAWNRRDVDGFMNGYAHSSTTIFVSGDTVTRGWETVRARYKKKYANVTQMGRLTFSNLEITPLCSDVALVLGQWLLQRKDDHPHGRFTLLFRHTAEGWRIVQDHTSAAEG